MLAALARWCARHRGLVVVLWVLAAVLLLAGARLAGEDTPDEVEVPGSDSAAANSALSGAGQSDPKKADMIVTGPVGTPAGRAALQETADAISAVPGIGTVPRQWAPSPDGTAVRLAIPVEDGVTVDRTLAQDVLDAAAPAEDADMAVALGGSLGRQLSKVDSTTSEVIGIVTALLVLLLAFGSAVAALLPVVTALVVVAGGLGGLRIL